MSIKYLTFPRHSVQKCFNMERSLGEKVPYLFLRYCTWPVWRRIVSEVHVGFISSHYEWLPKSKKNILSTLAGAGSNPSWFCDAVHVVTVIDLNYVIVLTFTWFCGSHENVIHWLIIFHTLLACSNVHSLRRVQGFVWAWVQIKIFVYTFSNLIRGWTGMLTIFMTPICTEKLLNKTLHHPWLIIKMKFMFINMDIFSHKSYRSGLSFVSSSVKYNFTIR